MWSSGSERGKNSLETIISMNGGGEEDGAKEN
jgi:hypothetical protein